MRLYLTRQSTVTFANILITPKRFWLSTCLKSLHCFSDANKRKVNRFTDPLLLCTTYSILSHFCHNLCISMYMPFRLLWHSCSTIWSVWLAGVTSTRWRHRQWRGCSVRCLYVRHTDLSDSFQSSWHGTPIYCDMCLRSGQVQDHGGHSTGVTGALLTVDHTTADHHKHTHTHRQGGPIKSNPLTFVDISAMHVDFWMKFYVNVKQ